MSNDGSQQLRVHLLDMGLERYGDCILCEYGKTTVLIDGGHKSDLDSRNGYDSIPDQLEKLLGHGPPFKISLLIVTHCHSDHIGCLPEMVAQGMLDPGWALVADENLGFGHGPDDANALDAAGVSPTVRRVVAALREESRDGMGDAELEQFLDEVQKLEPRYRKMLKTLEDQLDDKFIRYVGNKPIALEKAFRQIGLEILGPTQTHLLLCADAIKQFTKDAIDLVQQLTDGEEADSNSAIDDVDLYRSLVSSPVADASDRPGKGAALNDQSIVLKLDVGGAKVLLTGDMQFAKPEILGLKEEMDALREMVANDAKRGSFDFIKLAHHASYNGFDQSVFDEWNGSVRFGISGGIHDAKHPDPVVLTLLKRLRMKDSSVTWARTDRNGLITVTIGDEGEMQIDRGRLNSGTPNKIDSVEPAPPIVPQRAEEAAGAIAAAPPPFKERNVEFARHFSDPAHMSASFPYLGSRVTLTMNLEPLGASGSEDPPPNKDREQSSKDGQLGGGRRLPRLLFITSRDALRRNLGGLEADGVLQLITSSNQPLLDTLPADAADPKKVMSIVRARLDATIRGVVIVGGYDVVPAHRLDALDPPLRSAIRNRGGDPGDDYLIWSDAIYGDRDGDEMSEIPVSRIPDAKTPELVRQALLINNSAQHGVGGLRNANRPYANTIYSALPGASPANLLVSERTKPGDPQYANGVLSAGAVYLMLHGDYQDSQRFWGEDSGGAPYEAINVNDISSFTNRVVFCGACWGALTVAERAIDVIGAKSPSPRSIGSSMALSFLKAGARAFVGCTGSHYSPDGVNTTYYGAPMHTGFWKHFFEGRPPAEALYQAKIDYLGGIPHRRTSDPVDQAREMKILRQFTCLGLGW